MSILDGQDIGLPEDFFERQPRRGTPEEIAQAEQRVAAAEKEQQAAQAALSLLKGGPTHDEALIIGNSIQATLNERLDELDQMRKRAGT